jgi:hypothetical protein
MMIEIMNLRSGRPNKPYDMYVDRRSPVGNPYEMKEYRERFKTEQATRDYVCDKFDKEFHRLMEITFFEAYMRSLFRIYKRHGKLRLWCWCAPKRCHAQTIKHYIELELYIEKKMRGE